MRKFKSKRFFSELFIIFLGNFLLAVSVQGFILPNKILSGGVAGIAVALYPIFKFNQELVINFLVISLFIVGWLVLGSKFALRTILSSFIYPMFISLLSTMTPLTTEPLLATLYGGLLAGVGIGLVFRVSASTGGMDIPPLILEKYTHIKVSTWIVVIDSITILLGLYAYNIESVLIGFISVIACSYAINMVLTLGALEAKSIQIITPKVEEVCAFIKKDIDRGYTLIPIIGGYTSEPKTMILVVINKNQYPLLSQGVLDIDSEAFMIISDTKEVAGKGFSFEHRV